MQRQNDGVLHHGHYSLLESFNGSTYSVVFKKVTDLDQNSIVPDEIINNRQVGSTILVSAPVGSFALATDAKSHVFISDGIGIGSFMAFLHELNQQGKMSAVTLIQCVQTEGHAAFVDTLKKMLPQGQYKILTEQKVISKSHLEGRIKPYTHIYVSGPEAFLTLTENALTSFNHPKSLIHMRSIESTLRILQNNFSIVCFSCMVILF
ncbi:unnamed protein product [Rotaria sp. Silwood2]|nr:unnamed protein product [Rotaria sp. Silwood2]CAF4291060.1 unnamed protein product [Rotaria sp. Silwood2]CAF4326796.1 unnamed protein product [Rotaria sp. Silwood2]CAF4393985.1 unnamed protein product [Rotaria sp. Silwood2]